MISPRYFEAHVTIEPVSEGLRSLLTGVCMTYGFRLATFLKATPADNKSVTLDQFCTGHSTDYSSILLRMNKLVEALIGGGFKVKRYKIEAVLFDSKQGDEL